MKPDFELLSIDDGSAGIIIGIVVDREEYQTWMCHIVPALVFIARIQKQFKHEKSGSKNSNERKEICYQCRITIVKMATSIGVDEYA